MQSEVEHMHTNTRAEPAAFAFPYTDYTTVPYDGSLLTLEGPHSLLTLKAPSAVRLEDCLVGAACWSRGASCCCGG